MIHGKRQRRFAMSRVPVLLGLVFLMVPGMNHLLKAVPDDDGKQLASYSDPAIPLHPMLIDEISSFVKAADQRRVVRRD